VLAVLDNIAATIGAAGSPPMGVIVTVIAIIMMASRWILGTRNDEEDLARGKKICTK
jgi:hypothetical protein